MTGALLIGGGVALALGWLGTWFATNSPIQLQPLPGCLGLIGLSMILIATGGMIL